MALKVVHDGEASGALRENCCICRTKTNYWYEPKDIALCEHCAKTTKRAALPTKEEWCAKEDAIFKQKKHTLEASMALTPEQIDRLIQQADGLAPKEGSIFRALVKLTEAEVRKHDEREEQKHNYLKELAMCRDVFDIPPPEGKLEAEWVAAMASPEAVPLYVEACRQDYIDKLDAKDEEIRVLSAKIVDQQKHIANLKEG